MPVHDITEGITKRINSDSGTDYEILDQGTLTIQRVGSAILGFLITLIIILVPIMVALEVIYITMPIVRSSVDKVSHYIESKGHSTRVVGFVLRDAKTAITITDTTDPGKSTLAIYLGIKIKSAMFLAFILAMVLQGAGPLIRVAGKMVISLLNALK